MAERSRAPFKVRREESEGRMMRLRSLRRRLALWICPELGIPALPTVDTRRLKLFPTNRAPDWWFNVEIRDFLTAAHRQMTIADARAAAVARFGQRVPSLSSIQRYWARLDAVATSAAPDTLSPNPTSKESR